MEPPAGMSLKALSLGRGGVKAPLKPCREMVPCTGVEHRWPTHRAFLHARAMSAFVCADEIFSASLCKDSHIRTCLPHAQAASLEKLIAISLSACPRLTVEARPMQRDVD